MARRPTTAPRVEIVSLGFAVEPLARGAMRTSWGSVGVAYSGSAAPVTNCQSRCRVCAPSVVRLTLAV